MKYIWNYHLAFAIFLTLITLFISGSSTIWLGNLSKGEGSILVNFTLLIGSFIITAIPNILIASESEKAELDSLKFYIKDFSDKYQDTPEFILDKNFREQQEPWIANGSRSVIKESQGIIYSSIYSSAAFLIDAFTMSYVVNKVYIFGYIGGAGLYWLSSLFFKKRIAELSKNSLSSENSLTAILLKSWDNIICGNKYNFNIWESEMNQRFNNSRKFAVDYAKFSRIASSVITTVAILPILGITAWLFMDSTGNPGEKAILLAILPRQIQAMSYFDTLSYSLVQLAGMKNKLKLLSDSISEKFIQSWQEPKFQISLNKLHFSYEKETNLQFSSLDSLLQNISSRKNGRITIRGDNGAGKSVLMCKLKSYLSYRSKSTVYYLPPAGQLVFNTSTEGLSTGQKRFKDLNEVIECVRADFMLLDEWDANLDQSNIQILSKKLERLSKEFCIIEVRHREDEKEARIKQESESSEFVSFKKKTKILDIEIEPSESTAKVTTPLLKGRFRPILS